MYNENIGTIVIENKIYAQVHLQFKSMCIQGSTVLTENMTVTF